MAFSISQVIRQIQAAAEKPSAEGSVDLDTKRAYVAACQAADKLFQCAAEIKEPLLGKYVQLIHEQKNIIIPNKICRAITLGKAKTCVRDWSTG